MAGIAGIYCADGRLADTAELRRMIAAVEHRGSDGIACWNSGPVALAHLQFHTTPESLNEQQPLLSPGVEACLIWHGRLDNREELLDSFVAHKARPVDLTDPGLVLTAYLRWGTECVQHLVGDFALAIWDARQRRLWCARDYMGIRPFFYFWDGKTFLFGSEIRSLLAHPLVSVRINEGMAGEYLIDAITTHGETLYSDIRRLPPASTLTIDSSGMHRITSWWNPELSLLDYRTDDEYAAHFRYLLDQSVRSQTRCNAAWGIELSGGLDSSSIAVTARAALSQPSILTFSIASPGKFWDESEDIAAVKQKANLTSEFVQPLKADLDFFRERVALVRDFPGNPNGEPMTIPMYQAARRNGARVLLTGIGGDEWLDGTPSHIFDLIAHPLRPGTVQEFIVRARNDWRIYGQPNLHWSIFVLRRMLAGGAPRWVRRSRARRRLLDSGISNAFLRRTALADRVTPLDTGAGRRFSTHAQKDSFYAATKAAESYVFELNEREGALAGIEVRHPLFDRRLVEFCLRLPEEQRQLGIARKRMLRNAMRDRLPERLLSKRTKAEFGELFAAVCCQPLAAARLNALWITRHTDWFDPGRVQRRIASLTAEEADSESPYLWPLWMILGMDLWFEHVITSRTNNR